MKEYDLLVNGIEGLIGQAVLEGCLRADSETVTTLLIFLLLKKDIN